MLDLDENRLIFSGWDHGLADDEVVEAGRLFRRLRKRVKKASKRFMKVAKPVLKYSEPVLSVASTAYPGLAPAAAAVSTANRIIAKAEQGHRAARGALSAIQHHAWRGDPDAQRMMATVRQVQDFRRKRGRPPRIALRRRRTNPVLVSRLRRALPRLNYQHLLQLLRAARRGNPVAGEAVEYIAGCADEGDRDAQQMLLEASGNDPQLLERWAAIASGVEDPDDYDMEIDGEAEGTVVDQPLDIPELAGFSATADNEIIAGVEEILAGGPLWDHLKPRLGFRPESQVWSLRDNYGLGLEGIQQR